MGRVLKAIQVATKYKYRHYGCRRLILRDKHKPRMLLEGSSEATHEAGWLTTWPALMTSAVCVVMGYWIAFRYWDWPTTLYRFSSWRALLIFEKYPKPTWSHMRIRLMTWSWPLQYALRTLTSKKPEKKKDHSPLLPKTIYFFFSWLKKSVLKIYIENDFSWTMVK